MQRQILHIDVNNAFLSWTAIERLKNGETLDIRTIPAVIGGDEAARKGVVLAKSMIAKQFGVVTGETLYSARKKCPNLRVFKANYETYAKYSNDMYNLLLNYTDRIERFSIDECFLDMTLYLKKGQTLLQVANEIKDRIKNQLGFTVNIGVAHNKILAKMASDFKKPDKVHTLYEEEIAEKIWKMSVSELFMVGRKTAEKLVAMNIKTIGELAKQEQETLINKFGKFGKTIWEYANGIDESEVVYIPEKPKGIGNSITLSYDISDLSSLKKTLHGLIEQITYRLRKEKMLATVVSVQLKNSEFKTFSHQKKLFSPTDSSKQIYETATELLEELHTGSSIRLIGARVEGLCETDQVQMSIFDLNKNDKQQKIDKVLDNLKDKYGHEKIKKAREM